MTQNTANTENTSSTKLIDILYNKDIHHIGYVVENIDRTEMRWNRNGFKTIVNKMFDPIQGVYCLMLSMNHQVPIELVSPRDQENSIVNSRLKRGGGLDHICYKTLNIKKDLSLIKLNKNVIQLSSIEYSNIFNSYICFFCTKDGFIFELLETK